ncbi:MAG: DNA adenine methylase [Candidatus Nanoarchaeia archaeon]|nr:DNA adenine methylase [Candidatus Nanoarchaeia archaeon]
MNFYSPLRYPGGKFKLVKYFKELIIKNNLNGGVYVEPYAGGASVAWSLLLDNYVSKIIINDYDKSIYAFWYSVLNDTERLCNKIKRTKVNLKVWEKQKKIQENKEKADLLSLGFSTFFLNRTNISGIITAGPIGGKKHESEWKINCRFNKEDLIKRIKIISAFKDKIELYNEDAVNLLSNLRKKLGKKVLFYLDPPYYVKGKELYFNFYNYEDHLAVSEEIKRIKTQKWVVTYDDVKTINNLYKEFKPTSFSLNYSAGKTQRGKELIIFSKNINRIVI